MPANPSTFSFPAHTSFHLWCAISLTFPLSFTLFILAKKGRGVNRDCRKVFATKSVGEFIRPTVTLIFYTATTAACLGSYGIWGTVSYYNVIIRDMTFGA